MATLKTRPKYRFCWWCSRQLYGNYHQIMRLVEPRVDVSAGVIVHRRCADEMQREGGWEEAVDLDPREGAIASVEGALDTG